MNDLFKRVPKTGRGISSEKLPAYRDRRHGCSGARLVRQVWRDTSGAAAIMLGLMIPIIGGAAGLALDVGHWYYQRAQLQAAADAGALAIAHELAIGNSSQSAATQLAEYVADLNGLPPDITLTATVAADRRSATVTIEQPAAQFVSALFLENAESISVSATAGSLRIPEDGLDTCLLSLDPSGGQAVRLDSNGGIDARGCSVQVNSDAPNAIEALSNSEVSAESICVNGGYGGAASHYLPLPDSNCPAESDPLIDLDPPTYSGCTYSGLVIDNQNVTLNPGVYCDGLTIKNSSIVDLNPGTYVIRNADLFVDSNSTLSGDGVTIYLTDGAHIHFSSNTMIDLAAPDTGPYAGILFFQNRNEGGTHFLDSNSANRLEGVVYLPGGTLRSDSNSTIGSNSAWTMYIAYRFEINSNAVLQINSSVASSTVPLPHALREVALLE